MSYNGARPKKKRSTCGKNKINLDSQDNESKRSPDNDSNEIYRHLYVRLYDVLDQLGASAEFRKLRQDCSISREIILTINEQVAQTSIIARYIFGSSCEGTTIPSFNSDTDILCCLDTPVVDNIDAAGDGHSLLMIRDKHTQPGYVKLQHVYNGRPQTVYTRAIDRDNEVYDSAGRIFLKNTTRLPKGKFLNERNGPAVTDTDYNIDYVVGYRCSTIPEFAREWIGRKRQYKWPSNRFLEKMADMGCFVVGVGHPDSKERHIEWRLSFSLQERALMFSMNMVQHKCYVILKMIKKYFIETIVGKSISSYHLKTCIYHTIENSRLDIWKRGNLVDCVLLCLHVLYRWVFVGYCPNYFITEENMFDRDIHRENRLDLLHQIRYFILFHRCAFIFIIKLDNVRVFYKNGTSNLKKESILLSRLIVKLKVIDSTLYFRKYLCYESNEHDNAKDFISIILKYVSQIKSITDHNEQQTKIACSYILPYIRLQLAQSCAALAFNTYNGEAGCELLQESGYHLRQGRHCDLTSPSLLKATVLFKLAQYEHCIDILDQSETMLTEMSLSNCECFRRRKKLKKINVRQLNTLAVSELLGRISTCMLFLRSDMSITPEALHYEMFRSLNTPPGSSVTYNDKRFGLAAIDAVVYIHFMQYLANAQLNRRISKHVAINKLESVLKHEENLAHHETGYNLLGWICFQENWIQHGIKCFKKSWEIRPVHNAAKFHMLKLIFMNN